MPFEVGVAVVGDPSVPFTPSGYRDEDYLVPYRERARVTLEVEPEETLGSILIRAGEELGVVVGWGDTLLDPLSYVSFYKPGHEQGERVELFSWVTLADE